MFLLGLPDEDGTPHSEAVLPLKIKVTASAGQMQLARFWPTAKVGCPLDEAWATPVGTQQLGAKVSEGITLMSVMCGSSADLTWLLEGSGGADAPGDDEFCDPLK